MTVLEEIGARIAKAPPEDAASRLGVHLLDTVGAWAAGRGTEDGAMLARHGDFPSDPAAAPGLRDDLVRRLATTRLSEVDDIHTASGTTPGSIVFSTALSLLVHRGGDVAAFNAALLAGYDVMTRLGQALGAAHLFPRGIWPTYLLTPVTASAVAARFAGLDGTRIADAMAIALAQSATSPGGPADPTSRWLIAGFAARNGVAAADAAAAGFRGDPKLLDGNWFAGAYGIEMVDRAVLSDPGHDPFAGLSLKPWCAAKQTIAATDAFRELMAEGLDPDAVERIEVAVPPIYAGMVGHHHIDAGRTHRLTGVAYQMALAAYAPDTLSDVARAAPVADPRVAALAGRIGTIADPALERHYPRRWPARIAVTLKGGSRLERLQVEAYGDPERPLDRAAVLAKFQRVAEPSLGAAAADALAASCLAAPESHEALAALAGRLAALG